MSSQTNKARSHAYWPVVGLQFISTIGFAVLYASLVLFAHQTLHFSVSRANTLVGVFMACNYCFHLIGGGLGGHWISYRHGITVGLLTQAIGSWLISTAQPSLLYWGLAIIVIGNGCMATCCNMLISECFPINHPNRERGFFWAYSLMNLGFFIGFSLTGYFQLHHSYQHLFQWIMLLSIPALLVVACCWRWLQDQQTTLTEKPVAQRIQRGFIGLITLTLFVPLTHACLTHPTISHTIVLFLGLITLIGIAILTQQQHSANRRRMTLFFILFIASQLFWVIYQLAPMILTVFATYNIDRHAFGMTIAPGWINNFNTVTIILIGPLLAGLFKWLRGQKKMMTIPAQYILGMTFTALGLCALPIGIHLANQYGLIPLSTIGAHYVLLALAELCISPVSYIMIGHLVPKPYQSLMMGAVLLNTGVAATLAEILSNNTIHHMTALNPLTSNPVYLHLFNELTIAAGLLTILLFAFLHQLKKLLITHPQIP